MVLGPKLNNFYNLTGFFDRWQRRSRVTGRSGHAPREQRCQRSKFLRYIGKIYFVVTPKSVFIKT